MADTVLTDKARRAVDRLRDFAREHGMSHHQRDPLVMDIHRALDAFDKLRAEGQAEAVVASPCYGPLPDFSLLIAGLDVLESDYEIHGLIRLGNDSWSHADLEAARQQLVELTKGRT